MPYSIARVEALARRLGVSFREAARLTGRKGARVREQRRMERRRLMQPERSWWREGKYE